MKKLYRSRNDSKLFGLCGGLAELIHVDSTLLRVVVLVTAFFSGGTIIPIYFIACLVIPKEPAFDPYYDPVHGYANRPGYGPYSSSSYPGSGHSYSDRGVPPRHDPYRSSPQSTGYNPMASSYPPGHAPHGQSQSPQNTSSLDEMMRDLEKKALQKEVEELRAKLAQYEKKDKDQ